MVIQGGSYGDRYVGYIDILMDMMGLSFFNGIILWDYTILVI